MGCLWWEWTEKISSYLSMLVLECKIIYRPFFKLTQQLLGGSRGSEINHWNLFLTFLFSVALSILPPSPGIFTQQTSSCYVRIYAILSTKVTQQYLPPKNYVPWGTPDFHRFLHKVPHANIYQRHLRSSVIISHSISYTVKKLMRWPWKMWQERRTVGSEPTLDLLRVSIWELSSVFHLFLTGRICLSLEVTRISIYLSIDLSKKKLRCYFYFQLLQKAHY